MGFSDVFHRVAQNPGKCTDESTQNYLEKRSIALPKPDLAIEVAMEAGRRGVDSVPTLLKNVLTRAVAGARSRGLTAKHRGHLWLNSVEHLIAPTVFSPFLLAISAISFVLSVLEGGNGVQHHIRRQPIPQKAL
ncbi:hypothetical protein ACP0HM_00715 [Escherichia coli]